MYLNIDILLNLYVKGLVKKKDEDYDTLIKVGEYETVKIKIEEYETVRIKTNEFKTENCFTYFVNAILPFMEYLHTSNKGFRYSEFYIRINDRGYVKEIVGFKYKRSVLSIIDKYDDEKNFKYRQHIFGNNFLLPEDFFRLTFKVIHYYKVDQCDISLDNKPYMRYVFPHCGKKFWKLL